MMLSGRRRIGSTQLASVLVPAGAPPSSKSSYRRKAGGSPIWSVVSDGIDALRGSPVAAPQGATEAPRRGGWFGRVFDALAAPLATLTAAGVREAMIGQREKEAAKEVARVQSLKPVQEIMAGQAEVARARELRKHELELARITASSPRPASSSRAKSPASSSGGSPASIELCAEDGSSCTTAQLLSSKKRTAVVKLPGGKVQNCRASRGEISCEVDGKTLKTRGKH